MQASASSRVDVTFALRGDAVPRDHRRALAAALERRLPWCQVRELVSHGTLYAHLAATDDDELAFLATIGHELNASRLPCRRICGRRQVIDNGGHALTGYSLMLDGLSPGDSLRVLESGLGLHRRLACRLFVPHKSAAAVKRLTARVQSSASEAAWDTSSTAANS